jgi:hypothetical protein
LIVYLIERDRKTKINVDPIPTAIIENEGYESESNEIIRYETSTGWKYRFRSGSPLEMLTPNTLVTESGLKLDNPFYEFVNVPMFKKIKAEPKLNSHVNDLPEVESGEFVKQPTLKPNRGNHPTIHYNSDKVIVCILFIS